MILDRRPGSDPWVVLGGGQRSNINFFSEYTHLVYQIKGNHACNNIVADILPNEPHNPDTEGWVKRSKSNFIQNMVMLHIKLNGVTNAVIWYLIFCPQQQDGSK